MQQGRRTASLKASYDAFSKGVELTKELALGREYTAGSSRSAQAALMTDNVSTTKASSSRNKKCVGVVKLWVIRCKFQDPRSLLTYCGMVQYHLQGHSQPEVAVGWPLPCFGHLALALSGLALLTSLHTGNVALLCL